MIEKKNLKKLVFSELEPDPLFHETDPDPDQNETDPKHCGIVSMKYFVFNIQTCVNLFVQKSKILSSLLGRISSCQEGKEILRQWGRTKGKPYHLPYAKKKIKWGKVENKIFT